MLSTIELDDQPSAEACKISNISSDRNLSSEMKSFTLQKAQLVPQSPLGIGLVPP
jgi:hypothetical protein